MIANIQIPNDVLEELKQVAEVLGVPVEKCATEAIVARRLQRDAQGYLSTMEQRANQPKLELVRRHYRRYTILNGKPMTCYGNCPGKRID